jgi:hypothetical protein
MGGDRGTIEEDGREIESVGMLLPLFITKSLTLNRNR